MRFFELSIACYASAVTLPRLLELVPLASPVTAEVTIPGSKSITNRALLLAALSNGTTILQGALWSDDTEIMVNCLQRLGVDISVTPTMQEASNRQIVVSGAGGVLSSGGSSGMPVELYVGNAGTAARFLAALVCLGNGTYRLSGTSRMHDRPQHALFAAIRQLGYIVEAANDRLPAVIHGSGPRPGACCRVQIDESSQFASALMLVATHAGWQITVEGENAEESAYVRMTSEVISAFPGNGGIFNIEPDASSASYFWGADWLLQKHPSTRSSHVRVANWMDRSSQIDAEFPRVIRSFPPRISRRLDLGDSIMTALVLAPFADAPKNFVDLGRLRVQESERVVALRTELRKCGASVVEEGDSLTVNPGPLHGAEIETYEDHRLAMCFGMLALAVPGIRVRNPECVRKTFPDFFEKLCQLPPRGLGAKVRSEPS
jgi:3-phosphoshikimate 1-carboxyvinyltransferase